MLPKVNEPREISPLPEARNLIPAPVPEFDTIAPAPALSEAQPVVPQEAIAAPDEWFAALLIHHCHNESLVEAYPTEAEADAAAERFKITYLKGHDPQTYARLSGCAIDVMTVPCYLHGLRETERCWPRTHKVARKV